MGRTQSVVEIGEKSQKILCQFVSQSAGSLYDLGASETERMWALMEQYRDNTPMDLVDASLVANAESLDQSRIFTLDHHFLIDRLKGATPFDVVPA